MSQYTVIYKYGKRTCQLKIKRNLKKQVSLKRHWRKGENRFAPKLNEKKVVELLQNATPGSTKKATKYGMKIVQGKNLKLYLDNVSIRVRVSQSKTL